MEAKIRDQIITLADESFGKGYFSQQLLDESLFDSNQNIILEIVNDKLLGFTLVQLHTTSSANKLLLPLGKLQGVYGESVKIGYRKMTSVSETHQGKGISKKLFYAGNQWLMDNGAQVLVSSYWKNSRNKHFSSFMQKEGFEAITEVQEFWKKDSLERQFHCPACGTPPCTCDAIIYARNID